MTDRSTSTDVSVAPDRSDLELEDLLSVPVEHGVRQPLPSPIHGVRVGTLVAFADDGAIPLVTYEGQPGTTARPARTTIDVTGAHIGRQTVLMFEQGDPCRPIVMGVIQEAGADDVASADDVQVDADGRRLLVSAKEQVVLRCGKASITLTKEGKVLLQGAYVSTQSAGVLRLRGGSVQIN